ncbi:MAG: MBL fold metallo-hydrolase [Methanomassiliicoccales archaeon]|nr:MAG: MBL fold metallo-hydrolase [Methanomassiliicoccales archaeon]
MSLRRYHFIARMPDEPGALHRAAAIVKRYRGNIERIHYDRRIDPYVVFFEVTCNEDEYAHIARELKEIGYLQTSLSSLGFLKFHVYLPHRAGALLELLNFTTASGCNIAFLDFDDKSRTPDRLTVSLTIDDISKVDGLLEQLRSRYPLEIIEYDTTGKNLDDTVFYIRFAQELRAILGDKEDQFLMKLLSDIDHIVQELTNLNKDPKKVFQSVLQTGRGLKSTVGPGFYADVQRLKVTEQVELFCFQMPCGGNVYVLHSQDEMVMVDSGYAAYHNDIMRLLADHGLGDLSKLTRIFVTHADADHAGGAGHFDVPVWMHAGAKEIIEAANRAYGSVSESSVLEEVYTKLIGLFSGFIPPRKIMTFDAPIGHAWGFNVLGRFVIADLELSVLESLGGHQHGQVYFASERHGIVFCGDSVINFKSLSEERQKFNLLAKDLMTTVNVDSDRAEKERMMLLEMIRGWNEGHDHGGRGCLVCGGHGAVSRLVDDGLVIYGAVEKYRVK